MAENNGTKSGKGSRIDWKSAKVDYVKDETYTLSDIAAKYGKHISSVKERASREKWVELREKTRLEVDQKTTEALPESIAQTNLRHAGIGKALQGIGLDAIKKGMFPQSYKDARLSILSGVQIEREALGLSDKEVKDEVYQKFQQFSFIFNLSKDELQRFIKSALARTGWKIDGSQPQESSDEGKEITGDINTSQKADNSISKGDQKLITS